MHYPGLVELFENAKVKLTGQEGAPGRGLVRLETEAGALSGVCLVDFISGLKAAEHFYFSGREGDYEAAGAGCCECIKDCGVADAEERLSEIWKDLPDAVVFSGMSFFAEGPAKGEWDGFGALRLTLPVLEISRKNGRTRLAANGQALAGEGPEIAAKRLKAMLADLEKGAQNPSRAVFPGRTGASDVPGRPGWDAMMASVLGEIGAGRIEKAVLSRKRVFSGEGPWPVFEMVKSLAAIKDNSFVFLHKISDGRAFLGRSPERLLKVTGRAINVDAVAGTRPRGTTLEADKAYELELLKSVKELSEHRIVSGYIRGQMEKIATGAEISDTESLIKLENVQHIITRHSGILKNGRGVLNTVRCFHPTPAVGGHPSMEAIRLIRENEPYERGWFAGPIGWMNGREADFAVGIRSALVEGNRLHVFAGAGIVEGSLPEAEWLETEQKMRTIAKAAEIS